MTWLRARPDHPCPVCGKPDYCGRSADGTAVICMRIASNRPTRNGGWLHRLSDSKPARPKVFSIQNRPAASEIPLLVETYCQAMTADRYKSLSAALGVSAESLNRLDVGFDGAAYTFPMFDAGRQVIGIRRRFPNGRKICVKGSRNGLFLPDGLSGVGMLLIVEGNTDTAAGLDLGFDTIGRPSCSGGADLVRRFVRKNSYSQLVIIPDNDDKPDGTNPGASGGLRLAAVLRLHCRDVRIVLPPAECNDLRGWLSAGLKRAELLGIIEDTKPLRMEIIHYEN